MKSLYFQRKNPLPELCREENWKAITCNARTYTKKINKYVEKMKGKKKDKNVRQIVLSTSWVCGMEDETVLGDLNRVFWWKWPWIRKQCNTHISSLTDRMVRFIDMAQNTGGKWKYAYYDTHFLKVASLFHKNFSNFLKVVSLFHTLLITRED